MGLILTTFWLGWSSKQHFHDSWRSICYSSSHNHGSVEKCGSGRWVLSTRSFSTFIVVGKNYWILQLSLSNHKLLLTITNHVISKQSTNSTTLESMLVKTCFMSANKKVATVPSNSRFPVKRLGCSDSRQLQVQHVVSCLNGATSKTFPFPIHSPQGGPYPTTYKWGEKLL